jgi:hypothetical protein
MMLRQPKLLPAALLLAVQTACIPHVPHGPRIEPGTHWNINASVLRSAEFQGEGMGLVPGLWAGASRGWVASSGAAVSAGVQLPVLLLPYVLFDDEAFEVFTHVVVADVYAQPRQAADGGIDFGVGAMVARSFAMPYLQLGGSEDGQVYTTQGVAFTRDYRNRATYWVPALALRSQRADGTRTVDYYVSGAVGRYELHSGFGVVRRTEGYVTLGVVAALSGRR